ncbi:WD40/YVTN/BNR-like repeat-containing protein [Desulfothermobacter acidiphilus]|uniref:WD40/YVTN/BNR-like repeat-containing protein n=1 Tax=Desulfothermobacter acidiphilus TaxID=1938353 RepID=UPI003F8C01A0
MSSVTSKITLDLMPISWKVVPVPGIEGGNALRAVVYGGKFVTVGTLGTVMTSSEGLSWKCRSGTSNNFSGVAYGAGKFLAVGDRGMAGGSEGASPGVYGGMITDLSGAEGPWMAPHRLWSITFGENRFVAVGSEGTIMVSHAGNHWSKVDSGTREPLYGVAFGAGRFVAVGGKGTVLTSLDGITWTPCGSGTTENLYGITYGGGKFVAVGNNGTILLSSEGSAWVREESGTTVPLHAAAYGAGSWAVVGGSDSPNEGVILLSFDASQWEKAPIENNGSRPVAALWGVAYGSGHFIAVGDYGEVVIEE